MTILLYFYLLSYIAAIAIAHIVDEYFYLNTKNSLQRSSNPDHGGALWYFYNPHVAIQVQKYWFRFCTAAVLVAWIIYFVTQVDTESLKFFAIQLVEIGVGAVLLTKLRKSYKKTQYEVKLP